MLIKLLYFLIILIKSINKLKLENYKIGAMYKDLKTNFFLNDKKYFYTIEIYLDFYYDGFILINGLNKNYIKQIGNKNYNNGNINNNYFCYRKCKVYLFLKKEKNIYKNYPLFENVKYGYFPFKNFENNNYITNNYIGFKNLYNYFRNIYELKNDELIVKLIEDENSEFEVILQPTSNDIIFEPKINKFEIINPLIKIEKELKKELKLISKPFELYLNDINKIDSIKNLIKENCINTNKLSIKINLTVNNVNYDIDLKKDDLIDPQCLNLKFKLEYSWTNEIIFNLKILKYNNYILKYYKKNDKILIKNYVVLGKKKGYLLIIFWILIFILIILLIFVYITIRKKNKLKKKKKLLNN